MEKGGRRVSFKIPPQRPGKSTTFKPRRSPPPRGLLQSAIMNAPMPFQASSEEQLKVIDTSADGGLSIQVDPGVVFENQASQNSVTLEGKPIIVPPPKMGQHVCSEPPRKGHRSVLHYDVNRYLEGKPLTAIADVLFPHLDLAPDELLESMIETRTNNFASAAIVWPFDHPVNFGRVQEVVLREAVMSSGTDLTSTGFFPASVVKSLPWALPKDYSPEMIVGQWESFLESTASNNRSNLFISTPKDFQADVGAVATSFRPEQPQRAELVLLTVKFTVAVVTISTLLPLTENGAGLHKQLKHEANLGYKMVLGNPQAQCTDGPLFLQPLKFYLLTITHKMVKDLLTLMIELADLEALQSWSTIMCSMLWLAQCFEYLQTDQDKYTGEEWLVANAYNHMLDTTFLRLVDWFLHYLNANGEGEALLYPAPGSSYTVYHQLPDAASKGFVDDLRQLVQCPDIVKVREKKLKGVQAPEEAMDKVDLNQASGQNAGRLLLKLLTSF
ncbi:MAG: hypothetical protein M1823_001719 [Watsoniomyces obsoletus]|nr:MAG: hypothetical protein M1823_001719 [Watsoniomyces obsoletus]